MIVPQPQSLEKKERQQKSSPAQSAVLAIGLAHVRRGLCLVAATIITVISFPQEAMIPLTKQKSPDSYAAT